MIPISRDQKIKKVIDGVTYSFLPPVGDLEIDIIFSHSNIFNENYEKYYDDAIKILKKDGKKKPSEKGIKDKIMSMIPPENTGKSNAKGIDTLINKVLTGWESTDLDLPEFISGDCAADMPFELKQIIYGWYWDQIDITGEEVKN